MTPRPRVDSAIPAPEALLGFTAGQRAARCHEIAVYLQALATASDRASLGEYGVTPEGRKLLCLTISSPRNLERLPQVSASLGQLIGQTDAVEGSKSIAQLPAVVWMGYGIHGDEISGSDAAVELAYRLCAGLDEATLALLDALVIHIDPMANPDGRERFLAHIDALSRKTSTEDVQDLLHTQRWPEGRGNHYLFDLNRDAIFSVQQESRARVAAITRARPQLYVDAHEMAPTDTYLFAVPAEPLNPHLPRGVHASWAEVVESHGAAFDEAGVSFYTRSWNEVFYPGFFDIWPAYFGAVPVLYEQAGTSGTTVRLPTGKRRTYADALANQLRSSLASLQTAARHKEALLHRWVDANRHYIEPGERHRLWLVLPTDAYKLRHIECLLARQGIRVERLAKEIRHVEVHTVWSDTPQEMTFPAGTLLIHTAQPLGAMARNILDFHVPMDRASVDREREALELSAKTRLLDVTAWSLPLAYGAEVVWCEELPQGEWQPIENASAPDGAHRCAVRGRYGYVFNDPSLHATARLLARDVKIRVALEAFACGEHRYEPGALLIRNEDQSSDPAALLGEEAAKSEVSFHPVDGARVLAGADLGGPEFALLTRPRIALLTGALIDAPCSGAVWHLFDACIGLPITLLDLLQSNATDLFRYNVLLLPDASEPADLVALLKNRRLDRLRRWVESGGTLIALARGALALADSGLTAAKSRAAAMDQFPPLVLGPTVAEVFTAGFAAARDMSAAESSVSAAVMHAAPVIGAGARPFIPADSPAYSFPDHIPGMDEWLGSLSGSHAWRAQTGERLRRYLPRGAYVRADLRRGHWLRYSISDRLPVLFREPDVLVGSPEAEVIARYAAPRELALSGLIWPEAVGYIAGAAGVLRERWGEGQIVLFGNDPVFRGYSLGTQRLFLNAALLGPTFHAS